MSATAPVLINGAWIESAGTETFRAFNPQTGEEIGKAYPVSPWSEIERAVEAAHRADQITRSWPAERFAEFLDKYAAAMEANADAISELAHLETALPVSPRLKDVELPRAFNQMKTAAACARCARL